MIPRPVRNNNPGDLESGPTWMGLEDKHNMTPAQLAEPRFAVFKEPKYGFRALAVLLRNYILEFGADTVRKGISRFAPPNENPTTAYELEIAHEVGVGIDDRLNAHDRGMMFRYAKAVARFETGSWEPYWTDQQLNDGLDLAGYAPETA